MSIFHLHNGISYGFWIQFEFRQKWYGKSFFLPRVLEILVNSEIKKTFLRTCESDTHIHAI